MNPVVVDTNILFSILLRKNGQFRDILFQDSESHFYCCRFSIIELFKHKDKLLACSKLTEPELLEAFHFVLNRLSFYNEFLLSRKNVLEALELCRGIDEGVIAHGLHPATGG